MVIDVPGLIQALQLQPHPEGGHYRRVHDGRLPVSGASWSDSRMAVSAIHFLLDRNEYARWHRILQEEIWHHADGGPMVLHMVDPALEAAHRMIVGPPAMGGSPFVAVPPGWWQAAQPLEGPSLVSCIVAPSFDFEDHTFLTDDSACSEFSLRFPDLKILL